jgi:hypothetical protein
MRTLLLTFGAGVMVGASALLLPSLTAHLHAAMGVGHSSGGTVNGTGALAHTRRTFEFNVQLPMDAAGPLFGAYMERRWAPDWKPTFLWPAIANDQQGMVFTVAHGSQTVVWIAPSYDIATGVFQYVYVIPDVMVTLITLKLLPQGRATRVAVEYERTALNPAAANIVSKMADQDSTSGPEWEKQISEYLATAHE